MGGVPEGTFAAFTGPPKFGKTVTILSIAAEAQKEENGRRRIFYINAEGRIKPRDLKGIKGLCLDDDLFTIIQSKPGNIITCEKYCYYIEKLANEYPNCLILIDSISILSPESEWSSEIGKQDRGAGNKIFGQLCRRLAPVLPINKTIILGITHQYANTSGYGAGQVEKSANAFKYAEDIKLVGKTKTLLSEKEHGRAYGQSIEWYVDFSALGPPGQRITSYIRYGMGLDKGLELTKMATDVGVIEKKGAWLNFGGDTFKHQGEANFAEAVNENPEIYNEIRKQTYEFYGMKC